MYDRFPYVETGEANECFVQWEDIAARLDVGQSVICVECYPGVFLDEMAVELKNFLPHWNVIHSIQ